MVFADTYQTAKQIESLEPLLTKDDAEKVDLLQQLVRKHLNLNELL
jgi:BioD-like phosphotransacetylase family protein